MPSSNPVPADIKPIIQEARNLYREAHKDVKFSMDVSKETPVFNLDPEQIKRAMINLFENAVEAVDGAGEIRVDLDYDRDLEMVRVVMTDNGKGIPQQHKARLFEPYFSTKKHGTGLGLVIVNTIITDHNGFIRVQDNHPKGTKFIIELPVRI
jgi:two-component system nitrogen regulation sensor histidine kinase NtrY